MLSRLMGLGILLALASPARAAVLRVNAEPPLSTERLGDALRSYVDGVEVRLAPRGPATGSTAEAPLAPGEIGINLLASPGAGREAELQMIDGEETILARLPGALRPEDLYRAAALKVEALMQRRAPTGSNVRPAVSLNEPLASPPPSTDRDRLCLEAGLALMLPSQGLAREGLRLGTGVKLRRRWRVGLAGYIEPPQSTNSQGIKVSAWEFPLSINIGFAWHQGRWQGWLDALAHAAVRRVSAEAPGTSSGSDTALSPRAGGALGFDLALGARLLLDARVSLLAALADTRYRINGQVVWPAARTLLLFELGLAYGVP